MPTIDLGTASLRDLNQALHNLGRDEVDEPWEILNPRGSHAVAVGVDAPLEISVYGSVG